MIYTPYVGLRFTPIRVEATASERGGDGVVNPEEMYAMERDDVPSPFQDRDPVIVRGSESEDEAQGNNMGPPRGNSAPSQSERRPAETPWSLGMGARRRNDGDFTRPSAAPVAAEVMEDAPPASNEPHDQSHGSSGQGDEPRAFEAIGKDL